MIEQLRLLIELQTLDSELIAKDRAIKAIPLRAAQVEKPLQEARANLEFRKKKIEDAGKKKRDKDNLAKDAQDRTSKLKDRSAQVKDTKSFNAHQREIDQAERDLKKSREESARLADIIKAETDEMKALEAELAVEEQKAVDFKATLETEIRYSENQLKEAKKNRAGILAGIEKDVYSEYLRILKKHMGLAVTPVSNGVCSGCRMNIMPQLYVEVQRGDEILHCPQCGRIIYYLATEE